MRDSGITAADAEFTSLDGTPLRGTFVLPPATALAAVFVHGGGVTRDEGGFFTRIAEALARAGVASLRFDIRGHGQSGGRQEDLTLSGVVNDVRAAADHAMQRAGSQSVAVIGASFGGGLAAMFASRHRPVARSLVLINPLLHYKRRLIDEKPYWSDDHIDDAAASELSANGYVRHSPSFKLGIPLLNELFYIDPHAELVSVTAPVLVIHGTGDTFVPVDSSRRAMEELSATTARLIEVEGAQHGIAVHDDPTYADPQTQAWQAQAIDDITAWVTAR